VLNPYASYRDDPAQTCRNVMDWCAKGIEYISRLRTSPGMSKELAHGLEQWQQKLRWLQEKAKSLLNAYPPYPADVQRLVYEGFELNDGFARFMQTYGRSASESGGDGAAPAPKDSAAASAAPGNAVPAKSAASESVPIGGHVLPPLPYDYDALEPYIDETTMRLHHDKHHQAYVNGLNNAEKKMAEARKSGNFELITHWEREAAFHGAGHYLHTIFWYNMKPNGGGEPSGTLKHQIDKDFGGFSAFKRHFSAAAEKVEGPGWAILVWSPRARRLEILQAEKHQNLSQWDVVPLLVLDVWEHAYYLKYRNDRKSYIDAWWNVVNWDDVQQRFNQARQLMWQPF